MAYPSLKGLVEEVFDVGCAVVTVSELKRLTGRKSSQRVTKGVWRALEDAWTDLNEREDTEHSLIIGDNSGSYTLIYGTSLTIAEDSAYWHTIDAWSVRDTGEE